MTVLTAHVISRPSKSFQDALNETLKDLQNNDDVEVIDIKFSHELTADVEVYSALIIYETDVEEDEDEEKNA